MNLHFDDSNQRNKTSVLLRLIFAIPSWVFLTIICGKIFFSLGLMVSQPVSLLAEWSSQRYIAVIKTDPQTNQTYYFSKPTNPFQLYIDGSASITHTDPSNLTNDIDEISKIIPLVAISKNHGLKPPPDRILVLSASNLHQMVESREISTDEANALVPQLFARYAGIDQQDPSESNIQSLSFLPTEWKVLDYVHLLWKISMTISGFLVIPTMLTMVFCHQYPSWFFGWNHQLLLLVLRVQSYLLLLHDRLPDTDDDGRIQLSISQPNAEELNRFLPTIKWLLVAPQVVVYTLLYIIVIALTIIAWLNILITKQYPLQPNRVLKGHTIADFVMSVIQFQVDIYAYAWLLCTDTYPRFKIRSFQHHHSEDTVCRS